MSEASGAKTYSAVEQRLRDEKRREHDCFYAGWSDCQKGNPAVAPAKLGLSEEETELYRAGYVAYCKEAAQISAQLEEIEKL